MQNGWECPECGTIVHESITLCVCGYDSNLDSYEDTERYPADRADNRVFTPAPEEPVHQQANRGNIRKPIQPFGTFWQGEFGPRKITLLCLIFVFFLRGTTDGLWCIALFIYCFAARYEDHRKYGLPIIKGKNKNQTILEFGIGRTVAAIMFPKLFQEKYVSGDEAGYTAVHIRIITAMCIFHLYIALVILLDYGNANFAAQLFTRLNEPFTGVMAHWPGYQVTAGSLLSHGYAARIPIVTHVYVVGVLVVIVLSIIYAYSIYEIPDLKKAIRRCYESGKQFGLPSQILRKSPITDSFKKTGIFYFLTILISVGLLILVAFLFIYGYRAPLHFPGEPHLRHGKYIFMESKIYTDNIGLFSLIYLLPLFCIYGFWLSILNTIQSLYIFGHYFILKNIKRLFH